MARRHPDELEGEELTPLAIAARRGDARRIEEALDRSGVDYTFEITEVVGKSVMSILFGSLKKGVMFLVRRADYGTSRDSLQSAGLGGLLVDL